MKTRHLDILRSLLSAPTAPFHEGAVVRAVEEWAARLKLAVGHDASGNLLLRPLSAAGAGRRTLRNVAAGWVFAAHLDHPGFVARAQRGRQVQADFIGSVRPECFRGGRVVFFLPGGGEARAVVRSVRPAPSKTHLLCRLELAAPADVPPDTPGMWDFPAVRIAGRRLAARGCDDIVGVSAVVAALGEVAARDPRADVTGLLTVAEEAELVGATAACQEGTIAPGTRVVAIEASAAQPRARLGDGVVVRVGDRVWTYDPPLTADISATAERLAKDDREFRFARQLMPGGVCESTVYALFGHQAAALCVPLGNYHNMSPSGRIAPERIDLGDYASLVKLLVALATVPARPGEAGRTLRERFEARRKAWRRGNRHTVSR